MRERVSVLSMAAGEYAAEVTEGENTTHHRVLVSDGLLGELGAAPDDGPAVVETAVRCLLARVPGTALEHDLDLDARMRDDPGLFDEVQTALA